MTDIELLHGYAFSGAEDDFTALVRRYANLVYSAALRQTRDPHDAEEISQAVFTILARKAGVIRGDTILSGWLLRTTRLVALNAQRRKIHRRRIEREAMGMNLAESESAWKQIAPFLDEALLSLNERDRDAVVERFFEQKSFKEIGERLRTSEDNAQKRVSRAVARMRVVLTKRGVVVPSTILVAAISANAVHAAPGHLVASAVGAATSASATVGWASTLAKTSLSALNRDQLRTQGLKGALLASVLAIVLLALYALRPSSRSVSEPDAASPTPAVTPAQVAGNPVRAQSDLRQLRLQVIDSQTALPIPNAHVTATQTASTRRIPSSQTNFVQTDILGESRISFGFKHEEDWNLLIEIIKDGYVPRFVSWNELRGDLIEEIPAAYTVKLDHGLTIGGLVSTETGEPIPEVAVALSVPSPSLPRSIEGPPEREGLAIEHTEVTDAQGRWLCNHVPPQIGGIKFSLSHPDYVSASFDVPRLEAVPNSGKDWRWEAELREQKAVVILKPGIVVTGVVVDEESKPVPGAELIRDRYWNEAETIGTDGRFRIGNIRDRDLVLTVVAEGFEAKDMTLHPAISTNEVRFELARAAVLRGRVVDNSGQPIQNATVVATGGDFDNGRFHWGTLTDEMGRFEWHSTPHTQKLYSVQAAGYDSLSDLELVPDGAEHVITLKEGVKGRRLRISGTAVDAENGKPIDAFEVWVGSTLGPPPGRFGATLGSGPQLRTTGTAGRFAFMTPHYSDDDSVHSYAVELRANGYHRERRDVPGQLTNDYQVPFALKWVPALTGIVQSPNGQPAAGAVVLLCGKKGDFVYMSLPGQFDLSLSQGSHIETNTNGTFSLPRTSATGTVYIANSLGFSQVRIDRLATSQAVRLEPWGRVTGSVTRGANEQIRLDSLIDEDSPSLRVHLTTTTDSEGHFVMEGVPPGDRKISHKLTVSERGTGGVALTEAVTVAVRANEVTKIVLGAAGRKVVGRVQESSHRVDWQSCSVALTTELPSFPVPSRASFTSDAAYATAISEWQERKREFQSSVEGREALRDSREYVTQIGADGNFAFSNVLPGAYDLRIIANHPTGKVELNPSNRPMMKFVELIGLVDGVAREAIVPEGKGVDSIPFDLGLWEPILKKPEGSN